MGRFGKALCLFLLTGCSELTTFLPDSLEQSLFAPFTPAATSDVTVARWPMAKMLFFTTQQTATKTAFFYYLFFPDGQCYRECPRGGIDAFELFRIKDTETGNCGMYRVDSTKVTMYFPLETIVLARDPNLAYLEGDGMRYYRVREPGFDRISGRFAKTTDETRTIEFTAQGDFTAAPGAWKSIDLDYTGDAVATGSYTLSGNVLIFVRTGYPAVRTTFFTDPTDPATESTKLIYIDRNAFVLM